MMRWRAGVVLPWLLVLHGLATVSGPALHGLPALAHAVVSEPCEGLPPGDHEESGGPISGTHDCPICHFHVERSLPVTVLVVATTLRSEADAPIERPCELPLVLACVSEARAPPLSI
jgi:hypothetical protein